VLRECWEFSVIGELAAVPRSVASRISGSPRENFDKILAGYEKLADGVVFLETTAASPVLRTTRWRTAMLPLPREGQIDHRR